MQVDMKPGCESTQRTVRPSVVSSNVLPQANILAGERADASQNSGEQPARRCHSLGDMWLRAAGSAGVRGAGRPAAATELLNFYILRVERILRLNSM